MKRFVSDIWEEALESRIKEMLSTGKTEEEIDKALSELDYKGMINDFINMVSDDMAKTLESTMYEKVRDSENFDAEFVARNKQKWGKAFTAYRALYEICIEAAHYKCEYLDELNYDEKKDKQYTLLALRDLHGRACQMYLEILCLMENGFVDGAYARWRSLYELVIIACFISDNGEDVAKAFVECSEVQNDDYKWAKKAKCFTGKDKVSFNMIRKESSIVKGSWEQPYQLANEVVHATARGTFKRMGNWDGMEPCIPVGRSDYGLSTPGEHAAIMLSIITITFLVALSNIDTLAFSKIVYKWVDIVRKYFFMVAVEEEDKESLNKWLIENIPEYEPSKELVADNMEVKAMRSWKKRIDDAETVLIRWMRDLGLSCTTPDDCMDELIRAGVYAEPTGKARAKAFRDDLRSLREAYGMPYETSRIRIEQEAEYQNWYIYRK